MRLFQNRNRFSFVILNIVKKQRSTKSISKAQADAHEILRFAQDDITF